MFLPLGAEVRPDGSVNFRVWAPRRKTVDVVLKSGETTALSAECDGHFSGRSEGAAAGVLYHYRLDGEARLYPDPASRFQPAGPHGPSQIVDPRAFAWTDRDWRGIRLEDGQVIYEMHIGTFTREGTFAAAAGQLSELAGLGITVLELMPLAEFAGRFGWGYDGVDLYAPSHLYGGPDDVRRFVDRAHSLGMGVILDVVYNHFGPDGNYLAEFSEDYFTRKHELEWGEAINFDGENSGPVREFFTANAAYWVGEFHMDGLRLDATHTIHDSSPVHILAEIAVRAREAAGERAIVLAAEDELQRTCLVEPAERGGCGLDALWNDDLHHSARVAMTGRREAYYGGFRGTAQEFVSAAKYGFLYQGQICAWMGKRRGQPSFGLKPYVFVNYLQNHDQIANSGRGERAHFTTDPGRLKAMTALLLLAPGTPLLFQGQEFAASSPFLFFADHKADLAPLVREGRLDFLGAFRSLSLREMKGEFPDPRNPRTFERSKLDFADRERNAHIYRLHRDLLRLRREDAAFRAGRPGGVDGAVLGPEVFVLRFFVGGADDRLLLVNMGHDRHYNPAPEPLLAPPEGMRWKKLWSTEEPQYLGCGYPAVESGDDFIIPGHAAAVLKPMPPSGEDLRREKRLKPDAAAKRKRETEEG